MGRLFLLASREWFKALEAYFTPHRVGSLYRLSVLDETPDEKRVEKATVSDGRYAFGVVHR